MTPRQKKAKDAMRALEGTRTAVLVYACSWVDGGVSDQDFKHVINQYRDAVVKAERRWR